MDFVKLSEQRFTAKKFDVNKKIPRDDVEKLKTILQLSPATTPKTTTTVLVRSLVWNRARSSSIWISSQANI